MVVREIKINHYEGSCWFPHSWNLFQVHCCPCKFCSWWVTSLVKQQVADGGGLILVLLSSLLNGKCGGCGIRGPSLPCQSRSLGSCSWLTPSLAQPLPHTFQTTALSTLLLLQCTPHLCSSPLALHTPPAPTQLLVPFLFWCWIHLPPLLSLILLCCPSFWCFSSLCLCVFYPWDFSQAVSMISAGRNRSAPKKQTASGHSTAEHHASVTLEDSCKAASAPPWQSKKPENVCCQRNFLDSVYKKV